jgi:O-antigen/teichoic acid export membrane protein
MSFRKNTLWNLAGSGLPLFAGIACIPYLLASLGAAAFGVLTLIWALIGYFSLFDMGMGRALTYELSSLPADQRAVSQVAPTLQAGVLLTACAGVSGALILFTLAPVLTSSWLKIPPLLQGDAKLAFQVAAIGIVPTTITSGLRGALEGVNEFAASNIAKLLLGISMFSLPTAALAVHGDSLSAMAMYLVAMRAVVLIALAWRLRKYFTSLPNADLLFHSKKLFSYGGWITVSSVVGPMMVYGDRFFVGAAIGAEQLPLYAIPQEGLQRLLIIPAAITGALLPVFASMSPDGLLTSYKVYLRKVALLMLAICLSVGLALYPLLAIWLSPTFASQALSVSLILTFGVWINSIALVPYTVLHALRRPKLTAMFHIGELVAYAIALYYLVGSFGLLGAAFAWVGRIVIDLFLLHFSTLFFLKSDHERR